MFDEYCVVVQVDDVVVFTWVFMLNIRLSMRNLEGGSDVGDDVDDGFACNVVVDVPVDDEDEL